MKLFNKLMEKIKMREKRMLNERVKEDFQIMERNGEIWLTFSGCPVLPCSMLKDEPIDALFKIRAMHIESITNDN